MKKIIILFLLLSSNLKAEEIRTFCNAIDGGTLSIQFDEASQIVRANKVPQTKVVIDSKDIRFWNNDYSYHIRRDNGAMMIYLKDEVVGVLECSKPI
jgi:frataxin-like iron-binding protein CyaY